MDGIQPDYIHANVLMPQLVFSIGRVVQMTDSHIHKVYYNVFSSNLNELWIDLDCRSTITSFKDVNDAFYNTGYSLYNRSSTVASSYIYNRYINDVHIHPSYNFDRTEPCYDLLGIITKRDGMLYFVCTGIYNDNIIVSMDMELCNMPYHKLIS